MFNLNANTIASIAYKSIITDRGLIDLLDLKTNYVKTQSIRKRNESFDNTNVSSNGRGSSKRDQIHDQQSKKIWESTAEHTYTGNRYRRNRIHMGLRSRISRNSNGTLPAEIKLTTTADITTKDRSTISSYTTASRSIRKCCLTVFAESSRLAIRNLGALKNCKKRPYSCKSVSSSVLDLSKNTSAGLDTLGKKNDPKVQKRVISQVKDILKKPTSYNVIRKNPSIFHNTGLSNLFNLPEVIFHRFQATYSRIEKISTEKSRIVWGAPYTIVSLEAMFFQKIIDSCSDFAKSNQEVIYPVGLNNYLIGSRSVQTLREKFKLIDSEDYKIYSLDFSRFDETIPQWAKDLYYATTGLLVDKQLNEIRVYDYLRVYTKYTPFIDEEGINYKKKGISSGLLITNNFDSWWNLTICNFVDMTLRLYPEVVDEILSMDTTFDKLYMDKSKVKYGYIARDPYVRVMGDDLLYLCDEFTLAYHKKVCQMLGMTVTIKEVTENPDDPIFFLGRYWDKNGHPFQSEEYISLRICYTRWYNENDLPFSLSKLHLYRILSICLPLKNGKEFLDKYLFDYEPYVEFKNSDEGFVYMKDFIENTFQYVDKSKAFNVTNY